jgi:hypothetical protein
MDDESLSGSADEVLPVVNGFLWTEDEASLDPEFDPDMSEGDTRSFMVVPGTSSGIAPTTVEATVLVGPGDDLLSPIVMEIHDGAERYLVEADFDGDLGGCLTEGRRLSHRALVRDTHLAVAIGASTDLGLAIRRDYEATYGRAAFERDVRRVQPTDRAERILELGATERPDAPGLSPAMA